MIKQNTDEIIETLQELGLNLRESKCYVALLELGASRIGAICNKTGIASSKIYSILDKLQSKGLASYVFIGKIKQYQASNPKILVSLITEKQKRLENTLPQLMIRQQLGNRQNVEVFEGQKAIFSLFTDLISEAKHGEEYLVFAVVEENKSEHTNIFFKNLAVRRKEKGLKVKVLRNIIYAPKIKEKHTKVELRYTQFNFPQGITIFRNNVIMLSNSSNSNNSSEKNFTAIRIESEEIAKQFKTFFKGVWAKSKEG